MCPEVQTLFCRYNEEVEGRMDKLFTQQAIAEKYAELSRKRQMHRELPVCKGQTLAVGEGIQAVRETCMLGFSLIPYIPSELVFLQWNSFF